MKRRLQRLAVAVLERLDRRYYWLYQDLMCRLDAPSRLQRPRGDPPPPDARCITCRQRVPAPP